VKTCCEMRKGLVTEIARNAPFLEFRIRVRVTLHETRNCEMQSQHSGHICGRWRKELVQPSSISGIATWSVETLDHTNVELPNAEMSKWKMSM
jgi:hypothetical protein